MAIILHEGRCRLSGPDVEDAYQLIWLEKSYSLIYGLIEVARFSLIMSYIFDGS